jgi:2'-hydroxyisoflavone reductase
VWVPGAGDTAGFHRRSNRRALAAGLTFRPAAASAADTLAWFHNLPPERQGKPRAGLTPEREAAVLAKWKARGA